MLTHIALRHGMGYIYGQIITFKLWFGVQTRHKLPFLEQTLDVY